MKSSAILLPAFVAIALAQSNSSATPSTTYTTITAYTDLCTGTGISSTSTATITSNVCNICEGGQPPSTFNGVLTTYTTVYNNVCPTGSTLTPVTYTVTEPCPSSGSTGQPLPSSWIPQGFTTTVAQCACEGGSATLTVPAPTPTAPAAAPGAGSPAPGNPPAGSSAAGAPAAGAPAAAPPAADTPAEVATTGPASVATVAVELASNGSTAAAGNNTGPVPTAPIQPGAAARASLSVCSALMAAVAAVVYML